MDMGDPKTFGGFVIGSGRHAAGFVRLALRSTRTPAAEAPADAREKKTGEKYDDLGWKSSNTVFRPVALRRWKRKRCPETETSLCMRQTEMIRKYVG